MYSTSETEKDFLNKKNQVSSESVKDLSDRELQEQQTISLINIEKSNLRIKANLQFWFYFSLALLAISFLYFSNKN